MKIIFEDEDIIIIDKDKNLPVQSDLKNNNSLSDIVKKHINSECYIINRLDRPVSGLVIFTKNKKYASIMSNHLEEKTINKYYYAIVKGIPKNGEYIHYLKKYYDKNMSRVVDKNVQKSKKAILKLKVIKTKILENEKYSLVEIELITGRHHQIRVQMSYIGHPIYGDTKYNEDFKNKKGWFDIALHAYKLTFIYKNKEVEYISYPTSYPFNEFI